MDHFCLCRIRDLYRAILNFEQYFEQHYDLNLNEAMLLCTLSARSSQTAGEVAEALGLKCLQGDCFCRGSQAHQTADVQGRQAENALFAHCAR